MNAELKRNAWLELRPGPCGVSLAVLLLLVLPFVASPKAGWVLQVEAVAAVGLALALFYAAWGVRKAATAVTEEVRDRTWDQQRLSAHDGWSLVSGKLFGATAFTWFGAAGGLLVYAGAQLRLTTPKLALLHVAFLVTGTLAAQAMALLGSVLAASRLRTMRRGRAGWLPTVGMLLGLWMALPFVLVAIKELHLLEAGGSGHTVAWWLPLSLEAFLPPSLAAVAAWALVAATRAMRMELQLPVAPWSWLAFLAFAAAWLWPLAARALPGTTGPVLLLMLIAALGTYVMAVIERTDAVRWRAAAALLRGGERRVLVGELPLWCLSLGLVAACVALLAGGHALGQVVPGLADLGQGALAAATLALFVLRDAALILAAQLATPRWRGPEGAIAVGAFVLYVLLPLALRVLEPPLDRAIALFLPDPSLLTGLTGAASVALALPGCLAALAVAGWVARRALDEPTAAPKA